MIASEFQRLREAAGLTRAELAAHLGYNRSAIIRWETGQRQSIPSEAADKLREIAKRKGK